MIPSASWGVIQVFHILFHILPSSHPHLLVVYPVLTNEEMTAESQRYNCFTRNGGITPVHRLKVTILPLDLPCSGPVTHSGEILTTGKSHGMKPDRFSLNDNMDVEKVSQFEYKCNVHVEIQGFDEGIDYFIFYVFHRYVLFYILCITYVCFYSAGRYICGHCCQGVNIHPENWKKKRSKDCSSTVSSLCN